MPIYKRLHRRLPGIAAAGAILTAAAVSTPTLAQDQPEQYFPVASMRVGPYNAMGTGIFGGVIDYLNYVNIKHGGEKTTVYAHLSRIEVQKGQKVEQGQRVGLVGSTGWATGPHLHFEFRVNGQFEDPLKIAREADTVVVDAAAKPRFLQAAATLRAQLTAAESLAGYRGDAE